MTPIAFRVLNFRSISDSGWIQFSPDGVTIFVGQNESGKTSLLAALDCALGVAEVTGDDCRTDAPFPEVYLQAKIDIPEIVAALLARKTSNDQIDAVKDYLSGRPRGLIELKMNWELGAEGSKSEYEAFVDMDAPDLDAILEIIVDASRTKAMAPVRSQAIDVVQSPPAPASPDAPAAPATSVPDASTAKVLDKVEPEPLTLDSLALCLYELLPEAVLFSTEGGLLPNLVDISEHSVPSGEGALAALNFLTVADISLPELLKRDKRARETILNRANLRISSEFNSFWSQIIGSSGRLSLKCDIDHYGATAGTMVGRPHLVFWISDGSTQLYPKQRSLGVRWFVSFYLQLKASEKSGKRKIFLLDEPGANLHSKAQADVLKVINRLSRDTTIVYTTHSSNMIEYAKLFRVRAVQRDGEKEDSPTVVIDAHRLGTASSDTLSPVLSAMGIDLSNQQVIRKQNNVLIEEMSGFYYLTAFWKLTNTTQEAYFIAATGVNKVEALANMFRGWGLDFIVAIDNDSQGRHVYKTLKKELFGDEEERAKRKMVRLPDCPAIEDAFSVADFKRHILKDESASVQNSNSEYLKTAGRSKPVLAFQFLLAVEGAQITLESLEQPTRDKISSIVSEIQSRLLPS